MTDSSSDSDCFESADEGLDDDNITKSRKSLSTSAGDYSGLARTPSPALVDAEGEKASSDSNAPPIPVKQYRKRPERRKNPAPSAALRKAPVSDKIFKNVNIKPDALIQDITSNLSKNINKGFNTIQQTSSSIKDLVMSSLPVTTHKETLSRFTYDDDDEKTHQFSDSDENPEFDNSVNEPNQESKADGPAEEETISNTVPECKELTDLYESQLRITPDPLKAETQNTNEVTELSNTFDDETSEMCENINSDEEIKQVYEESVTEVEDTKECEGVGEYEEENFGSDRSETNYLQDENFVADETKTESVKAEVEEAELFTEDDGWDTSEMVLDLDVHNANCTHPNNFEENMNNDLHVNESNDKLENDNDNEGWDDFDFDDDLSVTERNDNVVVENKKPERDKNNKEWEDGGKDAKWSGWDHFGEKQESKQKTGWSLGDWGVNALLNTATSVTQGLSNVLEAGLGAPDPETLARMEIQARRAEGEEKGQEREGAESGVARTDDGNPLNLFPSFGITNLVAGVTKNIVESAKVQEIGSKVISGGLDTLESFGKKTMEVLQEGDPGLKKKRALLLGRDKPILSQILREAKTKADMEDRMLLEKQMTTMCHFETLFDDFQGLIHLEALEMLSRQCELKIDQIKASLPMSEVEELVGILDEVKELCVIDEDEFKSNYSAVVDFRASLTEAVAPLKDAISVLKILEVYEALEKWLKSEETPGESPRSILEKAMSSLAEFTAAIVQQFHKGGELVSVREHRKTVEEADTFLGMTGLVCCEIENLSRKILKLRSMQQSEIDERIVKKIEEETANATSYIKEAFNLLIPVLQLGAAT